MSYLWLAVLSLVFMVAFIAFEHAEKWTAGVVLKGCASLCFVILGALGRIGAADMHFADLVVAGLAVGAVADVLLNLRYVFKRWESLMFSCGTVVFLIGHVLYAIAVWPRTAIPWFFIIIGVVLTFFIMKWIFSKITAKGPITIIGSVYVGIVVILNCLAVSALFNNFGTQSVVFLAGTLLFFVSDIVLILNTFGGNPKFKFRVTNLTLYYIGQILIALSLQLG